MSRSICSGWILVQLCPPLRADLPLHAPPHAPLAPPCPPRLSTPQPGPNSLVSHLQMLAFTLIATLIVCVDKLVDGVNLGVSSTMLTVLGVSGTSELEALCWARPRRAEGALFGPRLIPVFASNHPLLATIPFQTPQTVLGFTISYRTSSAYERYIEGRKLWQSVQVATRLASRIIWFHCPNMTATEVPEEKKEQDAVMAILEKKVGWCTPVTDGQGARELL